MEHLPARPGERPDAGARDRRQGRHRRRLRGPLLLGHRDVRHPVPRLHQPRSGPQGAAVPLAPTAPGAAPGGRAQPGRRAVPVAHDHGRGGVRLLRRRHRPVPHQRRDRLRPQALPRRQRRHRLPRQRGGRDARRDGAAVGGPRLLRHQRRGGLPHPRRDRSGRVHNSCQRQLLYERDGTLQHALRGARRGLAEGLGPRRLRRARPPRRPPRRGDQAMGAGLRFGVPALRRRRSGSTRRTTRSSASSRGTSPTRRPTSTPCCCTSTRS